MNKYAGLVENGVVVTAIVGSAEWAIENLGGVWYPSDKKIPVPGLWDEEHGFRPVQPFLSWVWNGENWAAPIPQIDLLTYWDENTLSWVSVDE